MSDNFHFHLTSRNQRVLTLFDVLSKLREKLDSRSKYFFLSSLLNSAVNQFDFVFHLLRKKKREVVLHQRKNQRCSVPERTTEHFLQFSQWKRKFCLEFSWFFVNQTDHIKRKVERRTTVESQGSTLNSPLVEHQFWFDKNLEGFLLMYRHVDVLNKTFSLTIESKENIEENFRSDGTSRRQVEEIPVGFSPW